MTTINVYLNFNGNCEEVFNFYKSIFGGEFTYLGRFGEMPKEEGMPEVNPADANKVSHVSLPISKETILMGSDVCSSQPVTFGNNFSISITPSSKEEAERLFNGLSEGGKIIMPMSHTFWNAYFGMFTDKFGINWLINFEATA